MVDLNNLSLSEILEKSRDFITQGDYQSAYQLCQKALELSNRDPIAIELSAVVEMELGLLEEAKQKFLYLVENNNNNNNENEYVNYDLFCNLAQLSMGKESMQYYRSALGLLLNNIDKVQDSSIKLIMEQNLVDVVVSLVELYMTDLVDEADAEQQCEQYLKDGLSLFPKSPELLQTLASVRISQERNPEAMECLRNSMQHWLNNENVHPPAYEMRISLIRLLIELNMLEEAIQVGSGLERENEQDYELWYLLGLVSFLMAEQLANQGDAQLLEDVVKESYICFEKMMRFASIMEDEDKDAEMMQSGEEMRLKLLVEFPYLEGVTIPGSDDEFEGGEGGDMEWTDASDE
ncbi:TPR-like protein [Conidiobolus coronatus NRRL 28638]|uniref:TPR-like protein n=1 Tax=Conidiobolus coronatus (strain ATCC 28846 / CBS 209.66 / NRRL 28638) TaxID=796925 RepID=A0A137NR02_CONC2|nr:TPR-like protein [Conidiobolus coronatus NRRL 28638]|eukprot:KXN65189.1 TPR-like protein [Conidiobolus coronatus NRRL 28638]